MKRSVLMMLGLLISVCAAGVTPLLVEAYQEGTITIPTDESDEATVATVSFSVDSACYVLFAIGGLAQSVRVWLELDGDSLPPVIYEYDADARSFVNLTYISLLDPGEHTVLLRLSSYLNSHNPATCKNGYLQALIFLPDEPAAVAEQPPDGDYHQPQAMRSVVSQGPYVNVTGATELVDATGRVIENAITEDKVYISNLPTGTYFARSEERTVVKIVKVD